MRTPQMRSLILKHHVAEEQSNDGDAAYLDEEDVPLGDMLKDMASRLGSYGDRKELERELQALKAALAADLEQQQQETARTGGVAPSTRGVHSDKGPHRASVGKAAAAAGAEAANGAAGRGGGRREVGVVVRHDISSSDESADEGRRTRAPAGRRPHIYKAQGLHAAAAEASGNVGRDGIAEKRKIGLRMQRNSRLSAMG